MIELQAEPTAIFMEHHFYSKEQMTNYDYSGIWHFLENEQNEPVTSKEKNDSIFLPMIKAVCE